LRVGTGERIVRKTISGVMLSLLFTSMLALAFNIQPIGAGAVWREVARWSGSAFPYPAEFNMEFEITHVDWRVRWSYNSVGSFEFESLLIIQKDSDLLVYDSSYFDRSGVRNVYNEAGNFSLDVTCLNMYEYTIIVEQDEDSAYARTAYIRADGSVDPLTTPIITVDMVTYTFVDNIYDWTVVVERDNIIIDGNGYALQCTKDRSIHWIDGIDLSGRTNVTVRNIQIENFSNGIILNDSFNNSICGNNIADSAQGIDLWKSFGNRIFGNNLTDNYNGMIANNCSDISISGNNITNGTCGIWLMRSSNNRVNGNTLESNDVGISLTTSFSNNIIYHNNFINNGLQFVPSDHANVLDDGYPSGGNYWTDYKGVDVKSGPNQDTLGSDWIGDTPYVIDTNNKDRYPLMNAWVYTTKPTANAGQDKTANAGATLTFDGSSSADDVGIISYEWDFGDGTSGTGKTTTHRYANLGTYIVTLTVKDAEGNSATHQITVTVRSAEGFPTWAICAGAAIGVMGIVIATALLRRKRK